MAIGTYISIIILNVNRLNTPTKRHRLAEWTQKKTHIYSVYKKPTSDLKTYRLKVRRWKNIFHANGKQKKAGVPIFFILRSILSDMRIATPAFFCFLFAWNIFFHPFTFSLYVSLDLK